jgi:hypothetical protein
MPILLLAGCWRDAPLASDTAAGATTASTTPTSTPTTSPTSSPTPTTSSTATTSPTTGSPTTGSPTTAPTTETVLQTVDDVWLYGWVRIAQGSGGYVSGNAHATRVNPRSGALWELWGTESGGCGPWQPPLLGYETGRPDSIELVGPEGERFELPWRDDNWPWWDAFMIGLVGGDLSYPNEPYGLIGVGGTGDWTDFDLPGVVLTAPPLQVSEPAMPEEDATWSAPFDVVWDAKPGGDFLVLDISLYEDGGFKWVDQWNCVFPNAPGTFRIPDELAGEWTAEMWAIMTLTRYHMGPIRSTEEGNVELGGSWQLESFIDIQ